MKASLTSVANHMSEPTVRVFLGFHLLRSFQLAIFNYMIGIMLCKVNALLLE